jgi:LPS export ABC transporter protein LptC
MREGENVTMLYAERDILKMRMKGKRVLEFANGDREFPEGLFLEFFDETGKLTSTLSANHAYFFKREYQWRGRGHVEVKNLETQEQLNTEELYWKPDTKRIFTDQFVTIREVSDVLYGVGLDAAQDLSQYTIRKPTGTFEASDDQEEQP